ncbi:hypothetical protein HU200_026604 [Digitaria exilis]|uniref:Uncharacterized protein n=1 Tax=Digitaria exilis TaxID=1010633 RepID=A0A835EUI3_9POAL|nr:hypothetical protein HU200_026604 [Digitaria exilis]
MELHGIVKREDVLIRTDPSTIRVAKTVPPITAAPVRVVNAAAAPPALAAEAGDAAAPPAAMPHLRPLSPLRLPPWSLPQLSPSHIPQAVLIGQMSLAPRRPCQGATPRPPLHDASPPHDSPSVVPQPYSVAPRLRSGVAAPKSCASGAHLAGACDLLQSSLPWGREGTEEGAAVGGEYLDCGSGIEGDRGSAMGIGGSHGLVRMGMTGCADREGDGVPASHWIHPARDMNLNHANPRYGTLANLLVLFASCDVACPAAAVPQSAGGTSFRLHHRPQPPPAALPTTSRSRGHSVSTLLQSTAHATSALSFLHYRLPPSPRLVDCLPAAICTSLKQQAECFTEISLPMVLLLMYLSLTHPSLYREGVGATARITKPICGLALRRREAPPHPSSPSPAKAGGALKDAGTYCVELRLQPLHRPFTDERVMASSEPSNTSTRDVRTRKEEDAPRHRDAGVRSAHRSTTEEPLDGAHAPARRSKWERSGEKKRKKAPAMATSMARRRGSRGSPTRRSSRRGNLGCDRGEEEANELGLGFPPHRRGASRAARWAEFAAQAQVAAHEPTQSEPSDASQPNPRSEPSRATRKRADGPRERRWATRACRWVAQEERLKIAHGGSVNYVHNQKKKGHFIKGESSKSKPPQNPQQFQQHQPKLGQCTVDKDQCLYCKKKGHYKKDSLYREGVGATARITKPICGLALRRREAPPHPSSPSPAKAGGALKDAGTYCVELRLQPLHRPSLPERRASPTNVSWHQVSHPTPRHAMVYS